MFEKYISLCLQLIKSTIFFKSTPKFFLGASGNQNNLFMVYTQTFQNTSYSNRDKTNITSFDIFSCAKNYKYKYFV